MSDTRLDRTTNLLSDAPADEDAFKGGGHERVANALASLIRDEEGGKAVALQGPYGSGKSTVIEILDDKIEDDGETRIFTYDAWEHQGDPLRRSFLESLIEFLRKPFRDTESGEEKRWAEKDAWKDLEERLARRTETTKIDTKPKLTNRGRLMLILLFLAPVGLVLLNNFVTNFWGSWQTSFPGWLFWAVGLTLVAAPLLVVGWTWLCADEDEDPFYLLVKETRQQEETKTIQTPDPTTIEFQNFFETILSDALEEEDRQLIFVVDNLDRLQPEQALSTWATMRTFFEKNRGATKDWTDRFWLIVPFNFEGLLSAFQSRENGVNPIRVTEEDDEGGGEGENQNQESEGKAEDESSNSLAKLRSRRIDEGGVEDLQAFIDKTFATTFRVAPPVLSDWEQYMKDQLRSAFPDHESESGDRDDFHAIYRIYKVEGVPESTIPTPRDIKLFINRVSALYRQWKDEVYGSDSPIRLPVLAVYDLKSSEISQDGSELKESTFLDWKVKTELEGENWQKLFAALHFNVPPEKSIEVLIGEQVQMALENGDAESLKSLSEVSGFDSVLDEAVSSIQKEEHPPSITLSAAALREVHVENELKERRGWSRLRTAATGIDGWSPSSEKEGIGCVAILRHTSDSIYDRTAKSLLRSFSNVDLSGDFIEVPNAASEWTDGVIPVVRELLEKGKQQLVEENLHTPYSWPAFISALEGLVKREDAEAIAPFFKPADEMPPGGVAESIQDIASSQEFRPSQADAIYLMSLVDRVAENTDWGQAAEVVTDELAWDNDQTSTQLVALLRAALIMDGVYRDDTIQSRMTNQGTRDDLLHHLSENKDSSEIASLCVLLSMLHNPYVRTGNRRGDEANQGATLLNEILNNPRGEGRHNQLAEDVTQLICRYHITRRVLEAVTDQQNVLDFVYLIVGKIAKTDESFLHLDARTICDYPEVFTSALEEKQLVNLLERVAKEGDLLNLLTSMTKDNWMQEVKSESRLLDVVRGIALTEIDVHLGSAYYEALLQHAETVLEGSVTPGRLKSQWPDLLSALDESAQGSLLQGIQSRLIQRCDESIKPLLGLYWEPLVDSEAIQKVKIDNPTEVVRERFYSVLGRRNVRELEWLSSTLNSNADLYKEADQDARNTFEQRVQEEYEDAETASVRSPLKEVAKSVNVELLEKDDESASEEA